MKRSSAQISATVAIFIAPAKHALKVFGATPQKRLEMVLGELGANATLEPEAKAPESARQALCLRADAVYEKATLLKMAQKEAALVTEDDGTPLAAVTPVERRSEALRWLSGDAMPPAEWPVVKVGELGCSYNRALRKSEPPFGCVVRAENRSAVEERIYLSTYKGVTDLVTKYLWPKPALLLTRWFLRAGISPNLVTFTGLGFMVAALSLFSEGAFGFGLLAAWIMALFDTVDGKMARVSHRSSTFGEVLDHGMDLLHPPFWYLAWMYGLEKIGQTLPEGWFNPTVWLIFSTYIFVRLCEGYFLRRFGFHLHVWRRFDSFFRLIVARRNPNLILLTCGWLIGRPDLGFLSLVVWQLVAAIMHLLQIVNAEWSSRHSKLRSWLEGVAEASVPREGIQVTSQPKLAILANPRGGNNRTEGAAVAALARAAGLPYREASEPKAIRSALQELAAGNPDVLVVSGGDGTISAVATALRQEPLFKSEPVLALLRGGSTNLIQSNIGCRRRPLEALKRLLQVCERGLPPQLLRGCKPMRVHAKGTDQVHYGFFWGAGALPRIMRAVQDRYERGGRRGLIGEAKAFAMASMRALFGRPENDAWLAPGRIGCVNGDAARTDPVPKANRIFLMVTSLNRLVLGLSTHLRNGGLRSLALNYPYRPRALAAYGLSWGRVFPWMRGDLDCNEHDAFAIQVWEDWALDGEIFSVGPQGSSLHIKLDAPFRFLAI